MIGKRVLVLAYVGRIVCIVASLAVSLIGSQALAKGATLLPGGATSLREGHGDWVVSCDIATQNGVSRKVCGFSQVQTNTQSHQRILAMELQPRDSVVEGALVLPFGLELSKGVTLQVDDGTVLASLPFQTCLPAGCLVKLNFDAMSVAALRAGKSLKVNVFPISGQEMSLSVSLKGFPDALARTIALLK
jgi:invasion protein IalB